MVLFNITTDILKLPVCPFSLADCLTLKGIPSRRRALKMPGGYKYILKLCTLLSLNTV